MRFNTSVNARRKHSIELQNFLGVDFSSSPLNVSHKRASFAKNLISKDGVNQKRQGWSEICHLGEEVVGVFINNFNRHGEIDNIILVQTKGGLYRVTYDEDKKAYISKEYKYKNTHPTTSNPTINKDLSAGSLTRSQAFMSKNRLYILGDGKYLVFYPKEYARKFQSTETYLDDNGRLQERFIEYKYGDVVEYKGYVYVCCKEGTSGITPTGSDCSNNNWEYGGDYYALKDVVDDEETFLPTTTVAIKSVESGDTLRSSLDKANYLNSQRLNKILGDNEGVTPTEMYFDTYDRYAVSNKTYYTKTEEGQFQVASLTEGEWLGETFNRSNGYYEKYSVYSYLLDAGVIKKSSWVLIDIETENSNYRLANDYTTGGNQMYGVSGEDRFIFSAEGELKGYIDFDKGKIYLFSDLDTKPIVENEDNITVRYTPFANENIITGCRFGCQFGYKNSDTLFLSGNKEYPNQDFYSYTIEEDFTYFPVDNYQAFGTPTSAVKAYLRIADGTLAVLKEQTNSEPTIYYRGVSFSENNGIGKIEFPVVVGSVGEGAVNAFCCGSLGGDSLFVSPNGIFGLSLTNNIVVNERYARERDKYIHSRLIKHDLTKAVSTVFEGKFLLAVEDVCFVLDSRYKSTTSDDKDDTFNYECWYWDNMPINCFCSYNGELFFGSKTGLCRLNNDKFVDEFVQDIGVVSVIPFNESDPLSNRISINSSYLSEIKNGMKIQIDDYNLGGVLDEEYQIYADEFNGSVVSSITRINDFKFTINFNSSIKDYFKIGQKVVIDVGDIKQCVRIYNVDTFSISINTEFERIWINENKPSELQIYTTILNNKTLYITNFDGETFQLSNESGEVVRIAGYTNGYVTAKVYIKENVQSIWYSPVLDLGSYDYSKNLDSLSVVLDSNLHGKVRFGYETKKVTLDLMARQVQNMESEASHHFFDFDNIDFDNFTFETAFASSYTKNIRERNINFIMFKVVSVDDDNCALNSLKVNYTLYKKNRGVR